MADLGLFVGFGYPVRGREEKASTVFNEAVALWSKLEEEGKLESWEAIFLDPHGGDLGGFFLLRGDPSTYAGSDEFRRLVTRAALIVENFGVVGAQMGDRIAGQMQLFLESSAELT